MEKTFNKKHKEWKNIIVILCLFNSQLFFSVTTILGYQYEGIDNSNIYAIYTVLISLVSLLLFVGNFIKYNNYFNYLEIAILFVPFVFLLEMMIRTLAYGELLSSMQYFVYFCLWAVPAVYAAVYIKKTKSFNELIKWLEIVEWIFTFAVVVAFLIPYLTGDSYSLYFRDTNVNYQSASYMCSFAYGLNLYFIFYGKKERRFRWTSNRVYFWISLGALLTQLLCVFIAGGRGGAVLSVLYTVFFVIMTFKDKLVGHKFKGIVFALSIIALIIFVFPLMMQNSNFYNSFSRSFAFIDRNGINWEGTSGRGIVYQVAYERAIKKPIVGYGIFYTLGNFGYPHNLFLEFFLEGGILFLIIGIVLLFYVIKKSWILTLKKNDPLILVLFLYPITMLMFSSTYIQTGLFWFVICYIIMLQEKQ